MCVPHFNVVTEDLVIADLKTLDVEATAFYLLERRDPLLGVAAILDNGIQLLTEAGPDNARSRQSRRGLIVDRSPQ